MSEEIERKFLVLEPPHDIGTFPTVKIDQGYLEAKEHEIRLRKKQETFFLTIKRGRGMIRKEVEIPLNRKQFERLWPLTENHRIEKLRTAVPYEGHTIELDVYQGALFSLVIAEVEFDSAADAIEFFPPSWFGREVTDDDRFKNESLALHGLPDSVLRSNLKDLKNGTT